MDKPNVTGIQHLLTGVRNYKESRAFYSEVLGVNDKFYDYDTSWNSAMDLYRGQVHVAYAGYYGAAAGGVLVECAEMLNPTPRLIRHDFKYGDIGINKITIEVADVDAFIKNYKDKINFVSTPKSIDIPGWGDYRFVFGKDIDGNLIEFVSSSKFSVEHELGAIRSIALSVTELDRSIEFYQKHLGFDTFIIKPHEKFSGMVGEVSGSDQTKVRSCLLGNSNGYYALELIEVSKPRGRSMPFFSIMGDIGWHECACMTDDVLGYMKYCIKEDLDVACHPTPLWLKLQDKWEKNWFMHIRDPDGILVELIG